MGLFPLEPDPRTTSFYVAGLGKQGLPPDADGWEIVYTRYCPLFTTGRRSQRNPLFRALRQLLAPLTVVPGVREYATDRVAVILRKPASP